MRKDVKNGSICSRGSNRQNSPNGISDQGGPRERRLEGPFEGPSSYRRLCRWSLIGRSTVALVIALALCAACPCPAIGADPVSGFGPIDVRPEALNRGLEPGDVAFHPTEGMVCGEQKFHICQFSSGHLILVGFYYLKMGPIDKCGVTATILCPDERRYFAQAVVKKKAFSASTEYCSIEAGPSYTRGRHPDYVLHVEADEIYLHLTFHTLTPGWRPGTGRVLFGEDREKFYDVVVQAPRARAEGVLKLGKGETIDLDGMGYVDHCYSNILPTDQAVNWYTLRAFGEKYTVNYLEFVTPEKYGSTRLPWLMVTDDEKILYATTAVTLETSNFVRDDKVGYSYPMDFDLKVDDGRFKLTGSVRSKVLIERFDIFSDINFALRTLAKAFFSRPITYRFLSDYDVTFELLPQGEGGKIVERVQGKGLGEVLFVK